MNTREMGEVMVSASRGKLVQRQDRNSSEWMDDPNPTWNWTKATWRVKPEPRELWFAELDSGQRVMGWFATKQEADHHLRGNDRAVCYREVL